MVFLIFATWLAMFTSLTIMYVNEFPPCMLITLIPIEKRTRALNGLNIIFYTYVGVCVALNVLPVLIAFLAYFSKPKCESLIDGVTFINFLV